MFTCREVTEICAGEQKLSRMGKLKFKFHLLICHACSSYLRQIELLRKTLKRRSDDIVANEEQQIHELEQKIIEQIKKATKS